MSVNTIFEAAIASQVSCHRLSRGYSIYRYYVVVDVEGQLVGVEVHSTSIMMMDEEVRGILRLSKDASFAKQYIGGTMA